MPKRQCGYRFGKPPYAAISFIWSYVRISKTVGKKSSPASAASLSIRFCSSRKYAGSAVFSANSLMGTNLPRSGRTSRSLSQKLLDRTDDRVLVADLARDDALVLTEVLPQVLDELPGAVGALDLAVREHVRARQDPLLEQIHAEQRVVHRPVVAVGEVERVDVPLGGRVMIVDELRAELVCARDHRPAALARVEERLAIDLPGHGVVDDVAALEALVLLGEPGVDPEALDADDLLLLVAHGAGYVHHVDDDRVGDRLGLGLPAPVTLVGGDGHDHGIARRVRAGGDLALERLPVRALEVAQRLGTDAPDARVPILRVDDLALALVLDVRQLELLAEDGRELVERHVDLEDVLAGSRAGLVALAGVLTVLIAADGIAGVAVSLSGAAALPVSEREVRDVDLRNGDRDEVLALAADELPLRDVLSQVLADLAAHDRSETGVVLIDLERHRRRV